MYLDFDDRRPPVPRVARALSMRGGVVWSIVAHAGVVAAVWLLPSALHGDVASSPLVPVPPQVVRYVHIAPALDRTAVPRPDAVASDRDRRSATRDRAAAPQNALPRSTGASPERVEGANGERPVEAEVPSAAAASSAAPAVPPLAAKVLPNALLPSRPADEPAPDLGRALRNLKGYFDSQSFDNPQGGQTQSDADIQFDSKGIDFGPWLRRFRAQIYRNWFIPQAAFTHKGRVVLQFNVHRDGRITDLQVVAPAAIGAFNASSFAAIQRSSPTMVLPADYPLDRVFFTVTFHYNDR